MNLRTFAWLVVLTACIAALVVFISRGEPRQVPPPTAAIPEPSVESAPDTRDDPPLVAARSVVATNVTVGDYLAEYWGDRWPEMKAAYSSSGLQFSKDFESSGLQPWEDARSEIQRLARSYYERDLSTMRSLFLMNTDEAQDSETVFTEEDAELEYLRDRFVAEVDAAMNQVLSQEPEKYPLADLRKDKQPGDFFRIRVEHGGWYAIYRCNYNDFPEIARLEKEKGPLLAHRLKRKEKDH